MLMVMAAGYANAFEIAEAQRVRSARPSGRAAGVAVLEKISFGAQPALFAAIALAGGIASSRVLWIAPAWLLLTGVAPLAGLALAARRSRVAWWPLLATWVCLGALMAEVRPAPDPQRALVAFADGEQHQVQGTITRFTGARSSESYHPFTHQALREQSMALQLSVSAVDGQPVSGGMRLTLFAPAEMHIAGVSCGDRMTVATKLRVPQQYHDPGVWDARAWLLTQGVSVLGAADARWTALPIHGGSASAACRAHALQAKVSARLMAMSASHPRLPTWLTLSEDDTSMLTAMVTGDRSYLQRSERRGFERTGSFHVLVVSGLHVGLIAALVFAGAVRLRCSRVVATALTAGIAVVYAIFTGFGTPVQRALWMVLLYLAARLLFRERQAMHAVGMAAICLLAADPAALFDAGFQMTLLTVIATGGLVAPLLERTFGPWLQATRRIQLVAIDASLPPRLAQFRVMLRLLAEHLAPCLPRHTSAKQTARVLAGLMGAWFRLMEMLLLSATVEVVMALPMALYFHRATLLALPVNLLLIPLLTILLPLALLTAAAALLGPHLAMAAACCLALPLHLAVGIVHFFSRMDGGDVRVATPQPLLVAVTVLLLMAAVWSLRQRRRLAYPVMAAFAASMLLLVLPPILHARRAHVLEVAALDVGQGDALLLVTPSGKTLMVDCGGPTGGEPAQHGNFEIGEDVDSPVLWSRGIRRLDAVALTHAHSDHMGGMAAVLRNFRPKELWIGNNPPTAEYRALLAEARDLGISVRSFHAGDAFVYGDMHVDVLSPGANYQPGPFAKNDDSLVLRVAYGSTSALLEGDAEAPSEAAMALLPSIHADLLKVGHHGSKTSTTPVFLNAVSPRYAVVSVGLHNLYHHPRFETLEHLQQAHVKTYRTDLDGLTTFYLDGEHVGTVPPSLP